MFPTPINPIGFYFDENLNFMYIDRINFILFYFYVDKLMKILLFYDVILTNITGFYIYIYIYIFIYLYISVKKG